MSKDGNYHCSCEDVDLALLESLFSVCDKLFVEGRKDTLECFDEGWSSGYQDLKSSYF